MILLFYTHHENNENNLETKSSAYFLKACGMHVINSYSGDNISYLKMKKGDE